MQQQGVHVILKAVLATNPPDHINDARLPMTCRLERILDLGDGLIGVLPCDSVIQKLCGQRADNHEAQHRDSRSSLHQRTNTDWLPFRPQPPRVLFPREKLSIDACHQNQPCPSPPARSILSISVTWRAKWFLHTRHDVI